MNTAVIIKYLEQNKLLCTLGALLCIYFTIQPWNRIVADGIWVSIGLISTGYVIFQKAKHHSFDTPKELKNIYWIMVATPVVSIISFAFSPLDNLPASYLEPDIRWLLAITIIMTLRDLEISPIWITLAFLSYAASSFTVTALDTNLFTNLTIRVNGDENAVPFGMFSASIAFILLVIFTSSWIKLLFKSKRANALARMTIMLAFIMLAITTALSGTRSAVTLIPIGIILTFSIAYDRKKALMAASLLLAVLSIAILSNPKSMLIQRLALTPERIQSYFEVYDRESRIKNQRLEQWKESICIFKKHPILGTGPRSFREAHQAYGDAENCDAVQHLTQGAYQAHSVYFDTLFSKGLSGILVASIFLLLLVNTIKSNWRTANNITKLGTLILAAAVTSHLINGLTLDLWFRNHVMGKNLIILALPLTLIFTKSYSSNRLTTPYKSIT